ncbi:hypothetical protein EUGRSUZ_C00747 [Eucalyptus grandis]|uniref:Uncharacterized protein n=2 Tax=Eucalyptus grandis TaxID=71139 RepID=A0ACC3LBB1_EUCGR|nr:hypothetical protein EUGRSUZ_C00747 [Eucalyptus grandis]
MFPKPLDITMSSQKPLMIFTLSLLLLLAGPHETDARLQHRSVPTIGTKRDASDQSLTQVLVARDIITLSIGGVKNTKKFVEMIPKLKSVQQTPNSDPSNLLNCVDGLFDSLSNLESVLKRLRHLKDPYVAYDTRELRRVEGRIMGISGTCRYALKDTDGVVTQMLNSNLADVAMLINSVERAIFGIGVTDKGAKIP